jgi:hypothetical protein
MKRELNNPNKVVRSWLLLKVREGEKCLRGFHPMRNIAPSDESVKLPETER